MQELIPSSLWALLILRTFLKEKSSNGSTMQHQFNTTSKGCQRRGYDISNLDKYRQMLQSRGTLYYSMRTAESMRACLTGICMDSAEEYFLRGLGTSENGIKAKCTEGVSMWAKVVGGTSGSGRMTSTMAKVGPLLYVCGAQRWLDRRRNYEEQHAQWQSKEIQIIWSLSRWRNFQKWQICWGRKAK